MLRVTNGDEDFQEALKKEYEKGIDREDIKADADGQRLTVCTKDIGKKANRTIPR
jgi:hypothetical protein